MFPDPIGGLRFPSVAYDHHPAAVVRIAADGGVDQGLVRLETAFDEGEIGLVNLARLEGGGKAAVRLVILGSNDEAGSVLVQAMNDSRPLHAADAGEIGAVGEQGVDQR